MKKRMMTLALLGLLAGRSAAPTALHYDSLDAEIPQSNASRHSPGTNWCCVPSPCLASWIG